MRKTALFKGITHSACQDLLKYLAPVERKLRGKELLLDDGERTDCFWIVTSGKLQAARYHYDGKLDLLQIFTAGDVVCLDLVGTGTRKSPFQISSMADSNVFMISYDRLWSDEVPIQVQSKLKTNIIHILSNENIRKIYKINVLYKKSLRTRIIVFLRQMYDKAGACEFDIGMDREQFAQYLGVNRSALSHELSLMAGEGMISFKKSHFRILNQEEFRMGESV